MLAINICCIFFYIYKLLILEKINKLIILLIISNLDDIVDIYEILIKIQKKLIKIKLDWNTYFKRIFLKKFVK